MVKSVYVDKESIANWEKLSSLAKRMNVPIYKLVHEAIVMLLKKKEAK